MLASRRWRNWNPPEIFQECPEHELTEPTESAPLPVLSVVSVPSLPVSETTAPSASIPLDSAEWREPFSRWLDFACVRSPRCFGGLNSLHIAFCEWTVNRAEFRVHATLSSGY